jgi:hypothetical protein
MIYIKLHKTDGGVILAMCDESLIKSVLDDGDVFIDVKSYSEFYMGDLVDGSKAKEMIDVGSLLSVNAIGAESVQVAMAVSAITKENVKDVKGVPYAQAYKVDY